MPLCFIESLQRISSWCLTRTKQIVLSIKRSAPPSRQQVGPWIEDILLYVCIESDVYSKTGLDRTERNSSFAVSAWPLEGARTHWRLFLLWTCEVHWPHQLIYWNNLFWPALVFAAGIVVDDLIMQLVGLRYTEPDMTISYPGFLYLLLKLENMICEWGGAIADKSVWEC